ncbi:ABC transporter permease [candidate division KSB1 bacterium]
MNKRPPKIAEWLLDRTSKIDDPAGLAGDFEEMYKEIAAEKGRANAWLWYWGQVIISIMPFFGSSISGSGVMFRNYLKIAYRNFKRQKTYSFLNIFSLSIGLSVFLLISLYVQYELSFDKFWRNSDRIYRVLKELSLYTQTDTTSELAPTIVKDFPEVVSAFRMNRRSNVLISYENKSFIENRLFRTDSEIFEVFTVDFIKGDQNTALDDPNSIVLSEEMAVKYFGDEEALGKVLILDNSRNYRVTGIFRNIPKNSHFAVDFFIQHTRLHGDWRTNNYYTYCLVKENVDKDELEKKFNTLIDKYIYANEKRGKAYLKSFHLQPLTDIHLHNKARYDHSTNNNNIIYIYILSSVAVLILVIGCINYVNLATARSSSRIKEVGIRQVTGARRKELIRQFLGESVLFSLISIVLSFVILAVVLPAFNSFAERELTLFSKDNLGFYILMVAVTIFSGLFSGLYPAMHISSVNPITALKGLIARNPKGRLFRNALVVFQFTISVILLIGTIIINSQLHYIKNTDVGYSKDQIIVLSIRDRNAWSNIETVRNEIERNAGVKTTSISMYLPNNYRTSTFFKLPADSKGTADPMVYINIADYNFVDVYDLEIVEGRNFSREHTADKNGAFLVNESLAAAYGWEDPVGKDFTHPWGDVTGKIVGVVRDFNFLPLYNQVEPMYIFLDPDRSGYLSIKIEGDNIPALLESMEATIKEFSPEYPFEYYFFDDAFNSVYRTEQKLSEIFMVFSAITILTACLGLIGLAAFIAEQKTKEIGTRKVLGATIPDIFGLLSKDFLKCVLIANVFAVPVIMFFMQKWLENFAYRIDIGIGVFVTACMISIILALLTVSIQSLKAAVANPVDSLKYE